METGRIRLRLHGDTENDAATAAALGATAHELGITDLLLKSLNRPTVETIVPDAAMRTVLEHINRGYGVQQGRLYRNITRYLDGQVRPVAKAIRRDDLDGLLSEGQLDELRELVRQQIAGFGALTPDMQQLAKHFGMEPVDWSFMTKAIEDSFIMGRVSQLAHMHVTYEEMLAEAVKRPRMRVDELALQSSLGNTREHLRRIGETVAGDVRRVITKQEAKVYANLINRYMNGDLKQTLYSATGGGKLTAAERTSLGSEKWAETESELKSELYHYFKDDPQQRGRDMWRVAVTDTRAANNTGRMLKLDEDGQGRMYYLVQADACKECRRAYLNADGSPIIFDVAPVLAHALATSGLNIEREHKGTPNSCLHPYCNCLPVAYVDGVAPIRMAA